MESTPLHYDQPLSFENENKFWKAMFRLFLMFLNKTKLTNEILLTMQENNSELNVKVGESIKIELPEPVGHDYCWKLDENSSDKIELLFNNFKTSRTKLSGKRGKRTVEFMAKKPGAVVVKLKYCKPNKTEKTLKKQFLMKLFIQ